jgi:hypothetical protein
MDVEQKLKEMGLVLPQPSTPIANFVTSVRTGNRLTASRRPTAYVEKHQANVEHRSKEEDDCRVTQPAHIRSVMCEG